MIESSSPTNVVNFLILVTFQIKDFESSKYEEVDYFIGNVLLELTHIICFVKNYTHKS